MDLFFHYIDILEVKYMYEYEKDLKDSNYQEREEKAKHIKKISYALFFIIPVILIAIAIGFALNKSETIEKRGLTVKIIGDRNNVAERYINDIDAVDDYLIGLPDKLVLTKHNVDKEAGIDDSNSSEGVNALTIPEDKTIYIQTDKYDSMTLMHEFFHLFDFATGQKSQTDEFKTLVEKYKDELDLNSYELSNQYESFVGVMLKYRYETRLLKFKVPEVYKFCDNLVKDYEKQISMENH